MCKNVFLLQLWVAHQFPKWAHLAFQLYYHLHQYTYQMLKQSNEDFLVIVKIMKCTQRLTSQRNDD